MTFLDAPLAAEKPLLKDLAAKVAKRAGPSDQEEEEKEELVPLPLPAPSSSSTVSPPPPSSCSQVEEVYY
jgi:hypothetical protein